MIFSFCLRHKLNMWGNRLHLDIILHLRIFPVSEPRLILILSGEQYISEMCHSCVITNMDQCEHFEWFSFSINVCITLCSSRTQWTSCNIGNFPAAQLSWVEFSYYWMFIISCYWMCCSVFGPGANFPMINDSWWYVEFYLQVQDILNLIYTRCWTFLPVFF